MFLSCREGEVFFSSSEGGKSFEELRCRLVFNLKPEMAHIFTRLHIQIIKGM